MRCARVLAFKHIWLVHVLALLLAFSVYLIQTQPVNVSPGRAVVLLRFSPRRVVNHESSTYNF